MDDDDEDESDDERDEEQALELETGELDADEVDEPSWRDYGTDDEL